MDNKEVKCSKDMRTVGASSQPWGAGHSNKPVAEWGEEKGRRRLRLENEYYQVELWPEKGGAITSYRDRSSGIEAMWRNPWTATERLSVLDQPMDKGSDLFDVMDGSWFVSLPNGFFPASYFGAPVGTHGEFRSLPWVVEAIDQSDDEIVVTMVGHSVRTPLVYRRELSVRRGDPLMRWSESIENRSEMALPVAWLQHPAFGGALIDGAELVVPAKKVSVYAAKDPSSMQLEAGYSGEWPWVPERETGAVRDCSVVSKKGSGLDHSVQLSELSTGRGCVWNEGLGMGFAMEWDPEVFPYMWSWCTAGGIKQYPLWGEGHLVTMQPSTSPVGRFEDLADFGDLLTIPAKGRVTTTLSTGFVHHKQGPWSSS